ncbi:polyprenol monophosphomannose synthase [Candidatus Chlorohelix allophototropha]|uniref:Polyprenol monophosphomannose synthase n=2 Tax=Candidatus Chlorohelix allophototropha TaxID=3003348 RepID=A0ABY9B6R7_9CHLR|nr:polyprenol monophosphomannose synthase [Chloroflexota bacterium L227-S17]
MFSLSFSGSGSATIGADVSPIIPETEDKFIMVVVPTYNEAENLPSLLKVLFGLGLNLRVLIVDDNSPDGTGQLANQLAVDDYPGKLEVLKRPGKMGLGSAYITGFKHALSRGASFIVEMDADFSHDPKVLKEFARVIKKADVTVGSRYVAGGSIDERWKLIRRIISKGGSIYARAVLRLKVQDTTAGFKMFRAEVLRKLPLEKVRSNGYAFQVEMAYLCQKNGFKVVEVPIHFSDRELGKSKMSAKIALEAAWRVWQIKFRY